MTTSLQKTILLSPVGGRAIYGFVQYFKEQGYKVIGIDNNPDAIGKHFVDVFHQVPKISDENYSKTVFQIMDAEQPDIFVSWLDFDLIYWNNQFQKNKIPEKYLNIFSLNFRDDLSDFLHKKKFSEMLIKHDLPTPKTEFLSDIFINKKQFQYPAFVKMCEGSGSKRTAKINNYSDLENLNIDDDEQESFVIQEFIEGQEYTIDFYAKQGDLINHAIRIRHEHQGVSLVGEIIENQKISELVANVCSKFNVNGVNNIQFIENDKGELFITDFNMRPSGTLVMTINAGVDLLQNLVEQHQNKEITRFGLAKKIKMVRYLKEFYYE